MKSFLIGLVVFSSTHVFASSEVPSIQVQGTCSLKVVPDRGSLSFTAENQSKNQKEASQKTTAQMNKLKEALKELKLEGVEFKNTNYSVHPVTEWEKEKLVSKGFRSSMTLEITTSDLARLGEAIQVGSEAGITNVGHLESYLSLEKSKKEYLTCLDIASDDAKAKAEQLGKKLGFRIGDVLSVDETPGASSSFPQERFMRKSINTMAASAQDATQIEAGTQQFSTTIQVRFKIK